MWLVGGAIRDRLLGREVTDLDVVVDGDPEQAARRFAAAERGPVFALSEEFGAWRALSGDRATSFDFSRLQGATIEDDLARRDFTINAIAEPLQRPGELIDPHGGQADLAAGRLRLVSERAYEDDPLRPLRLARFAAELGLRPEPDTARLTRDAAPRLSEPAAERVFAELKRTVVAGGVALADELGVLDAVLPELTALKGLEQSRFHHLDVFDHTLEVLDQLRALEHRPEVEAELAKPLADGLTRGEALCFGALFHDIGKAATRGVRPDGRATFLGHDAEGERIAARVLKRLRASEKLSAYAGKLTREHLALGFMVHDRPPTPRALHAYMRRCEPVEVEVTVLSCADRLATGGEGQERWIEAHLELAGEVMDAALAWREHGPPELPLRGDELGLEPGPRIAQVLDELEEAVYAGEVNDRDQALALVARLRRDPTP